MYFRAELVQQAVRELARVHPFFGITFLVCKKANLPIGHTVRFAINHEEERFLKEFYHPRPDSEFYFQPFRTSGDSRWLSARYPSTGSQSTRTRGLLSAAFLHGRGGDLWGWHEDYVGVLRRKLDQDRVFLVPTFWLAIWLFRNRDWKRDTRPQQVVETFFREFYLTKEEELLFDSVSPVINSLLTDQPLEEKLFLRQFAPPPDAPPDEGGRLAALTLSNVGPARGITFSPAERLSIITGDNGLGKTFLLECSWWALTGGWATESAAVPFQRGPEGRISFDVVSSEGHHSSYNSIFDAAKSRWISSDQRTTISAPIVYARVDGSFAVWDPARRGDTVDSSHNASFVFTREQVLNGFPPQIEGLLRDWVRWQNSKDQTVFKMFTDVLKKLSPPDGEPLAPGEPIRVHGDAKEIPTIKHEYGTVPVTLESAGIRRILTLAYLLVWAWNEHRVYSAILGRQPQESILVMIDEVEAHLHPKWQRSILPTLLDVTTSLSGPLQPQLIVATHSPLVLASIESSFNPEIDRLYHLNHESGSEVSLDEASFYKRGTVDEWLKSSIFDLKQPRSREGEAILEAAKRLLAESSGDRDVLREIDSQLAMSLPPEDTFWRRWKHFLTVKGAA